MYLLSTKETSSVVIIFIKRDKSAFGNWCHFRLDLSTENLFLQFSGNVERIVFRAATRADTTILNLIVVLQRC